VFAIIEMALPFGALGIAEQKISSSLAGLLIAAVPLANAVFLKLANHGDGWDIRRAFGLAIGLGGVTALVGFDVRADTWWAIAITMLAVIGYASGPVVIDLKLSTLPSIAVIAWGQAIAALIYAPIVAWEFTQDRILLVDEVSTSAWLSVVALGVFCTALAFMGLFALIDEVGPSRTTIITFINPAVAVILGILILDEPLTTGLLVGFPLVLIGSVIATRKSKVK
jgi:drug/metabolite transporter (DMT)-like permease